MLDRDVRRQLWRDVKSEHDPATTTYANELGLCCGATRVDLAVINGKIVGYEIKSERDTLARLRRQRDLYNRSLDEVVIVCAGKHADAVAELVPPWWGIREARVVDGVLSIEVVKPAQPNPQVDPEAVVQLLWREEMLCGLSIRRGVKGLSKLPKERLAPLVVDEWGDELGDFVRYCLKTRPGWPPPLPGDEGDVMVGSDHSPVRR